MITAANGRPCLISGGLRAVSVGCARPAPGILSSRTDLDRALAYCRSADPTYPWPDLLESLLVHGQREPIVLNPTGLPGGGFHRAVACRALGLDLAIAGSPEDIARVREWLDTIALPSSPTP